MGSERDHEVVDCREALHRIYHFLDDELTDHRRVEIEHHLNGCSPCHDLFGFEAELRRLVADRCHDEVPNGLRARIAETIDHEHSHAAPQPEPDLTDSQDDDRTPAHP